MTNTDDEQKILQRTYTALNDSEKSKKATMKMVTKHKAVAFQFIEKEIPGFLTKLIEGNISKGDAIQFLEDLKPASTKTEEST